jgi:hypothetical protein
MASSSLWQLNGTQAKFTTAHASGDCNLCDPNEGIQLRSINDSALTAFHLLGPNLPRIENASDIAARVDAYTRCGDLVGIYAPIEQHPFRSQAYWRFDSHALTCGGATALEAIELVASKQTDLLDSRPDLTVTSMLPATAAWQLKTEQGGFAEMMLSQATTVGRRDGLSCFVFRLPGKQFSYAEIVYPLDFDTTEIAPIAAGQISLRHHLFAHRLEKGVILRARVLGLILPQEGDLQTAALHYASFAASDPPLTT